eukprot:PITA_03098
MSYVPYASAFGSLMYAMVYTRLYIAHAVGVLSKFMSKTRKEHWTTMQQTGLEIWIREDLQVGMCLTYLEVRDKGTHLDQRSEDIPKLALDISGSIEQVYVKNKEGALDNNAAVSWMSKKQFVVELSTTEVEYMAATHASKEAVWLQRLRSSMGLVQGAIRIDCDSQSAIFLANNPTYLSKKKHINVQYHFVRDMIEDKKVLLVKVNTLKNTADALTRYVSSEKFSWCRETMGVSGLEK